ncbi:hypothetical protein VMCG_06518 [Cytospora schulzeri]|uniref:Uncharacterized protein n=1 Tax=Cytospora schulzeri TaxID=448051 RepID=A0A423WBS6_9PEZI|nr:hypothetical protein VMCG_06518 [Valsa malicola]
MKRSGRGAAAGSGPGAAGLGPSSSPPPPTPTTFFNLSSLSFFSSSSSSNSRSRPDTTGLAVPATTGGVATFANGATFGDPFRPERDDPSSFNTRTQQAQSLPQQQQQQQQRQQQQSQQSPSTFRGLRRRATSSYSLRDRHGVGTALSIDTNEPAQQYGGGGRTTTANNNNSNGETVVIDNGQPPALPDFALSSAAKLSSSRDTDVFSPRFTSAAKSSLDIARGYFQQTSSSSSSNNNNNNNHNNYNNNVRMLSRTGTGGATVNGFPTAGGMMAPPPPSMGPPGESNLVHQHIQEMANKRISTLEYLRKAHEGRVYWFNTLLFDKPDLAKMPYFDPRRLARRATNYLLLGLSLPTVIDLNSATPLEFLRSLNLLLTEFDSFQQLHSEPGGPTSTLSRARIPQMFRRATPSSKARRSSSANNEIIMEGSETGSGGGGGGGADGTYSAPGPSSSNSGLSVGNGLGGSASVVSFGQCEGDMLPGEEYVHLLTPSLPFDPDFFETFATLCDVLIDAYSRLLSLLATPRDCNAAVAELFTKADARVRKIIVQGIVKEFEDTSRAGVKTEVANVGKIVIGGLM